MEWLDKNKIDIVHLAGPDSNFILWVELTNILGIHLIYSHHTDITSYLDTRPKLNNSIIKAIIKTNSFYSSWLMEFNSSFGIQGAWYLIGRPNGTNLIVIRKSILT